MDVSAQAGPGMPVAPGQGAGPRARAAAHSGPPAAQVRLVLLPALAVVAGALLAQRFVHDPAWRTLLDNVHWTISYSAGAVLAWLGVSHAGADERAPRRWFALGLTAYALGQVLWDAQVARGWNPFPGPSDALYLLLGVCIAIGLVAGLRARTSAAGQRVAALDAGGLSVAALACTVALYLPLRGEHTALQMTVLAAYPVGLLTAACIAVVMVPTLRLRPDRGWILLLLALAGDGALWMEWNARTLAGTLDEGSLYNAAFSLAAIVLGLGAMWWRPVVLEDARWERRFEGMLRLLPLLLVLGASIAALVAFSAPGVPFSTQLTTAWAGAIVVTLSFVRQNVMLHERDRLLEAQNHFRTLFESSREAILLMNERGFVDCNPSTMRLFGLSREALCSIGPLELSPERQPDGRFSAESAREKFAAAMWGEEQRFEWKHLRRDGTPFDAEVSLVGVQLPHGRLIQAVVRDVTERNEAEATRRRLEEQLRHAARLESVGRLAGGVAHDFNNLLTVILGTSELALRRHQDAPTMKDLEEIRRAAQRAAGLTAQLLAFSRKQVIAPVPSDPNALVTSALGMLRRLIGEDVDLSFEPGRGVGTVLVDPTQMEQVLVNLAVNARDAMPTGGRLLIGTSVVELDAAACSVVPDARPGRYVRVDMRDTGPGISPEVAEHIFEPFFTTKEFGRGTGLGLSTVYGIVRQSNGFIALEPGRGTGACFRIHLPEVEASPQAAAVPQRDSLHPGREHILLVEDETIVRDLARRVLVDLGYQVTTASSGVDALAQVTDPSIHIDLLLTDVIMPAMSGRELHTRLCQDRPGLRVIYMSGYTDHIIAPHGVLDPGTHFIQKPFTLQSLGAVVRGVLDGPDSVGGERPDRKVA